MASSVVSGIAHGGLQGLVTHGLLNCTRVRAAFETMRGIPVSQLVRQDRNAKLTTRIFHGPLHIPLVHAVTD